MMGETSKKFYTEAYSGLFIIWFICVFFYLGGNPLTVLAKQVNMELQTIRQNCPLFDVEGPLVNEVSYS